MPVKICSGSEFGGQISQVQERPKRFRLVLLVVQELGLRSFDRNFQKNSPCTMTFRDVLPEQIGLVVQVGLFAMGAPTSGVPASLSQAMRN